MIRLAASLILVLLSGPALAQDESIRDLRLQGRLSEALEIAILQLESAEPQTALQLHLELAKIHDRIGLHTNTRPVAAALQNIESAALLAADLDAAARADVDLAYAEYFYRAEMTDRVFEMASQYAENALTACEALQDFHCQADAVHRQGLIQLQQRQLDTAQELFMFIESLRLDRTNDT